MLMVRFMAVFVYIIATLFGLKSFHELVGNNSADDKIWGWNLMILIACILIAAGNWLVDRRYCRKCNIVENSDDKA